MNLRVKSSSVISPIKSVFSNQPLPMRINASVCRRGDWISPIRSVFSRASIVLHSTRIQFLTNETWWKLVYIKWDTQVHMWLCLSFTNNLLFSLLKSCYFAWPILYVHLPIHLGNALLSANSTEMITSSHSISLRKFIKTCFLKFLKPRSNFGSLWLEYMILAKKITN